MTEQRRGRRVEDARTITAASATPANSRPRQTFRVSKFWSLPVAFGFGLLALNFFQNGPFGLGAARGPIVSVLWLGLALAAIHYLTQGLDRRSTARPVVTILTISGSIIILLTLILPVVAYGVALLFDPRFTLATLTYPV